MIFKSLKLKRKYRGSRILLSNLTCNEFGLLLQDVFSFLKNGKENKSLYKGSRVAISVSSCLMYKIIQMHTMFLHMPIVYNYLTNLQILDDTFTSQMQKLLGHSLEEKDLEPPQSIIEVQSMLCQDTGSSSHKNSWYYQNLEIIFLVYKRTNVSWLFSTMDERGQLAHIKYIFKGRFGYELCFIKVNLSW